MLLASAAAFCARAEPVLELSANLLWERPEPWFGGFSGIEVSANGRDMTVITDRGRVLSVRMIRDGAVLKGVQLLANVAMTNGQGSPLGGNFVDSEGLAIGNDGHAYVSFEINHRVARLFPQTGRTQLLRGHPDFADFQINSGLEGLAIHPDGTLFALPEQSAGRQQPFPLYTFRGGTWQKTGAIPRRGRFRPVGADFDAMGRLYLLERTVTPFGFQSRVRRFDLTAPDLGEHTLLTSTPGRFDNLEALSVWQDPKGQTHLTMISDDNFLQLQQTQIVEYTVTE